MKGFIARSLALDVVILVVFAASLAADSAPPTFPSTTAAATSTSPETVMPPLAWQWQFGQQLMYGVYLIGSQQAWAVGVDGLIVHSSDGGVSWIRQESGVSNALRGVFFVDASQGWVVGDKGLILHTADGGVSWDVQTSNTTVTLHALWFNDALHGWVGLTDGVLKTTNGGQTWQKVGSVPSDVKSIQFFDSNNGVLVCNSGSPGGGRLMTTANGGATWTVATCFFTIYNGQPWPCNDNFTALHFPSRSFGGAVGAWVGPASFTSTDGGATWKELALPKDIAKVAAISLRTPTEGYVVDANGMLYITKDGGKSWSSHSLGLSSPNIMGFSSGPFINETPQAAVRFQDANHGVVILGLSGKSNLIALRTADGGKTWKEETIPAEPGTPYLSRDGKFLTVNQWGKGLTILKYE